MLYKVFEVRNLYYLTGSPPKIIYYVKRRLKTSSKNIKNIIFLNCSHKKSNEDFKLYVIKKRGDKN